MSGATSPQPLEMSEGEEPNPRANRATWSSKIESVLSQLSYAVGLGNIWRFPYICGRNGGGAFLFAYVTTMVITGIPLVFLEMAFGQYARSGVVSVWSVAPLFEGVGWAMCMVSLLLSMYYNMIIAWALYCLFASFAKQLPWTLCGPLSSEGCPRENTEIANCTLFGGVWFNSSCTTTNSIETRSAPSHNVGITDYFNSVVLDISNGLDQTGAVQWQSALCLLLAWVLVCACLAKGIKSSGKAMYFMAVFPYLALATLLIRGLTLEGSTNGISYFFLPRWHQLWNIKIWFDASVQTMYSLSPCIGGLITLSSYNKFDNNCFLDSIVVSIMDCLTSILSGLVVFAVLGYMAHELQVDVKEVTYEGPSLSFVVYPEVISKLPISQLWAILFFAMLATVGLGSQVAIVTTIQTTLLDQFPSLFHTGLRRMMLLGLIAALCYSIGLVFCSNGGMYVFQLFDSYVATYSLLVIGFVECSALAWVYGSELFLDNIKSMTGTKPWQIWSYSWKFVVPLNLAGIMIFTLINFEPTKYGNYTFPGWAEVIGFLLTLSSVLAIPGVALYKTFKEKKTSGKPFLECIKTLMKPLPKWRSAKRTQMTQTTDINESPEASSAFIPNSNITTAMIDSNATTTC